MTQTVNGPKGSSPKQRRPGQRQQERLQRQARRRQRQRILMSIIIALVVIAVAALGFWQFQRYTADQAAAKSAVATATAQRIAKATATAAAAQLSSCLAGLKPAPTLKSGPTKPPAVTGTPVTMPDELQYIDVQVGCGPAAQTGSKVSVEYTGWLQSNGKKFDSSYDHGSQSFSVTLGQGQVIKGWDEGLVGVKRGTIRRLIIPAALAYGAQGSPPTIPPNATLIFDIVVISVQ